jgi:Pyruvate/2-oxoacid:ferredoxin oxidoreductase delta subunit
MTYSVVAEKCKGCTLCAKQCPARCITGAVKEAHVIQAEHCLRCGICMDVCRFDAVVAE